MIEHNELLREIDEDLKRERLALWWKNFGSTVVAASLGLVIVISGGVLWQQHREKSYAEATAKLLEASRLEAAGNYEQAATIYGAVASETRGDFSTLAELHQAGALAAAGKADDAKNHYKAVYDKNTVRATLRDLAGLRYADYLLASDNGKADAHIILGELAGPDRPYRWSALELSALADRDSGKIDDACSRLLMLKNSALPGSMKARVMSALSSLPQTEGAKPCGA